MDVPHTQCLSWPVARLFTPKVAFGVCLGASRRPKGAQGAQACARPDDERDCVGFGAARRTEGAGNVHGNAHP